jgi:hypothetical protein
VFALSILGTLRGASEREREREREREKLQFPLLEL